MICRNCKKEISDDFVFCPYCAEKCHKTKVEKKQKKIPAPIKTLKNGTMIGQMMVGGVRYSFSGKTQAEYEHNGRMLLDHPQEAKKEAPLKITLKSACESYIDKRSAVLSPSTIRGYRQITVLRFQKYMNTSISEIDFQKMVNDEAETVSAKTLRNSWMFVASVLKEQRIEPPTVRLPQVVRRELNWLDYNQIGIFLNAVKGQPVELAALLALHSLRRSELLAVTNKDISNGNIHVSGAMVTDENGLWVSKETNKNQSSARDVPVMIPRLLECLSEAAEGHSDKQEYNLITINGNSLHGMINRVCRDAGLPEVGVHGLRRSFASLCYHQGIAERICMSWGGWSDYKTMHDIYIKLSTDDKDKAAKKMQKFFSKTADFTTKTPTNAEKASV